MLNDARLLDNGAVLRADLCIIGGGAVGITLARELASTPLDVVVLESGGVNPDPDTQALYEGHLTGEPMLRSMVPSSLETMRLRRLGGSTNHWAGWCRPFQPVDLSARPSLGQPGWPFGREELDPYYERAHEVCRLGPFDYDPANWADRDDTGPALADTDLVQTDLFQVTNPMAFGQVYLDDLRSAPRVNVLLWANATELVTGDGPEVVAVDAATLDGGRRFRVEAATFVLATGGLEVPRLLLASNRTTPAGLGNENDQVGRNFAEHLHLPAGFAILNRPVEELRLYDPGRAEPRASGDDGASHVFGILTLTEQALLDHDLLGLEVQLYPRPQPDDLPPQDRGITGVQSAAALEATEGYAAPTVALLAAVGQQRLDPESRVTLGADVDALGMPRIAVDWRYSADDRADVLRGLAIVGDELARQGLGRVQLLPGGLTPDLENVAAGAPITQLLRADPAAIDPDTFKFGVGCHHMCTTRMDADPRRGVVDPDCRVHTVPNLYIGGSAVFPSPGVATPTLTIVALALRLADHLRAELA